MISVVIGTWWVSFLLLIWILDMFGVWWVIVRLDDGGWVGRVLLIGILEIVVGWARV